MQAKIPSEIYTLTAKALDLDEDLVKDIVTHQFRFTREWFKDPIKPALFLQEFGTFELKYNRTAMKILRLIERCRAGEEEACKGISYWWPRKYQAYNYRESKRRPSVRFAKLNPEVHAKNELDKPSQ